MCVASEWALVSSVPRSSPLGSRTLVHTDPVIHALRLDAPRFEYSLTLPGGLASKPFPLSEPQLLHL